VIELRSNIFFNNTTGIESYMRPGGDIATRMVIYVSSVRGTQRTLNMTTATGSAKHAAFLDIHYTGSTVWTTAMVCGNCSGISPTAVRPDLFLVNAPSITVLDNMNYASTSGGTANSSNKLWPNGRLIVDNTGSPNMFSLQLQRGYHYEVDARNKTVPYTVLLGLQDEADKTYLVGGLRLTSAATLNVSFTSGSAVFVGDLETYLDMPSTVSSAANFIVERSSSITSLILGQNLTCSSLILTRGKFDTANFTLTASALVVDTNSLLVAGTSTLNLVEATINGTHTLSAATLVFSTTSSFTGNTTLPTVNINSTMHSFLSAVTVTTLTVGLNSLVLFPAGVTSTVTTLNAVGNASLNTLLRSTTPGVTASVSCTTVNLAYTLIRDITAAGAAWDATNNCVNEGNTANITFNLATGNFSGFFFFFGE
jgi:hypothetical protein